MLVQLFQDGQVFSTDAATLRVWLAEGRVKSDAQVNAGGGWVPIRTFADAQQFVSRPQPGIAAGDVVKAAGIGAALVGGAYLLSRLFESGEKTEKEAAGAPKRRLFLSFDYDDKAQVDGFRLLAHNKNVDLEFRDGSLRHAVNSENDPYIRQRLREQMVGTSVCVCLIGSRTYQSDWVDWEIRTSKQERKGLLGIHLKNKNGRVPKALTEFGAKVIGWEPHSFAEAVENAAKAAGR